MTDSARKTKQFCRVISAYRIYFVSLRALNMVYLQGLEGNSRDPVFDQNRVRDSGKREIS